MIPIDSEVDLHLMSLMSLMGDCISQPTDFQQCPTNNVQYETNYKNKATNTHTHAHTLSTKQKRLTTLHTKKLSTQFLIGRFKI